MTSLMSLCSFQADWTISNFFLAIPGTSKSCSICVSNTTSVSLPKWLTILLAKTGPIPLISPDPRYFSRALADAGLRSTAFTALNWSPYFG